MTIDIIKFLEKQREEFADPHDGPMVPVIAAEAHFSKVIERLKKAMEDDYLGELYRTDYSVTGRGAFPIDMLRYTESWPKDESDVYEIEHSIEDAMRYDDPFTIRLTKHHRDPEPRLAADRWSAKFRWLVLPQSVETNKL
jgi:hypothetical protein